MRLMRVLGVLVPLGLSTSGCLAVARLNDRCDWTADPPAQLDLRQAGDRRHLEDDVEIAEELGIRYGDSFRKTRGIDVDRARTAECTAALLAVISREHGVPPAAVLGARGARHPGFDIAVVLLPMAALLFGAAWCVAGLVFRRFASGEIAARVAATFAASVVLTAAFYQFGGIWSGIAEDYRLRTAHLSYRGFYLPWTRHAIAVLSAGSAIFWAATLARYRAARAQE